MKKWNKPQLIVIKRQPEEAVLTVCKDTEKAGPISGSACDDKLTFYCCNQMVAS
jgi:hypothetical protein